MFAPMRWIAFAAAAFVLFTTACSSAQQPDGIYVLRRRGPPRELGARIRPARTMLYAIQNDNARYQLMVFYGSGGSCGDSLLAIGGDELPSDGYGGDAESCTGSWTL